MPGKILQTQVIKCINLWATISVHFSVKIVLISHVELPLALKPNPKLNIAVYKNILLYSFMSVQ